MQEPGRAGPETQTGGAQRRRLKVAEISAQRQHLPQGWPRSCSHHCQPPGSRMQEQHLCSSCSAWGPRHPQGSESPGDVFIICSPLLVLIWLHSGSQWQFKHHFDLNPFLTPWNEAGALSGRGFPRLFTLERLHMVCRTVRWGQDSGEQRQCWWHIIPPKQQSWVSPVAADRLERGTMLILSYTLQGRC